MFLAYLRVSGNVQIDGDSFPRQSAAGGCMLPSIESESRECFRGRESAARMSLLNGLLREDADGPTSDCEYIEL